MGLEKVNIVFLDGHAESATMDEVWFNMASKVMYMKHLEPGTCFNRAIFLPLGYVAAALTSVCCPRAVLWRMARCLSRCTVACCVLWRAVAQVSLVHGHVAVQPPARPVRGVPGLLTGATHARVQRNAASIVRSYTRATVDVFAGTLPPLTSLRVLRVLDGR
jgi:prepilin-type processing-associated H-X9-DG protein